MLVNNNHLKHILVKNTSTSNYQYQHSTRSNIEYILLYIKCIKHQQNSQRLRFSLDSLAACKDRDCQNDIELLY